MSKPKRYPIRLSIGLTLEQAEYLDDLVSKKKYESIAHALRSFVDDNITQERAKAAYDMLNGS